MFQVGKCTLVGSAKNHILTEKEILCLRSLINVNSITKCKKYKKIIDQSCRYTSCFYSKGKKNNDSVFETKNNRLEIITSIHLNKHDDNYDVYVFFKLLKCLPVSIITDSDVKDTLNLKKCSLYSNDIQCINYCTLHRPCIISVCKKCYYLSSIVKDAIARCIN